MSGRAITRSQGEPLELVGNNTMKPATLGNGRVNGVVIPINIVLTPEQIAQVSMLQLNQQVTTNVQHVTVHNHYYSPQEPPKHGNQEGPQGRLDQGRQQATPKSRTIENKPSGVDTLPSNSTPARITNPKNQESAMERSRTVEPAQEQKCQTRDVPNRENSSAQTTRSPSRPAASRHPQEENINSSSSNIAAATDHGQPHQRNAQPGNNSHGRDLPKVCRSQPDRDNGSRPNTNMPASVAKTATSGRHDSNSTGSSQSLTAGRPQNYSNSQPPHHHNQAVNGPAKTSTSGRQAAAEPPHVEPQLNRQHGAVHVPQRHSAVGQGTGAAAVVAEAIGEKQILAGFERLNSSLGNFKGSKSSKPTKVILIGKASTEMMKLEDREQAYHIDVIVDLPGGHKRRSCMEHNNIIQVFREFDKPPERPKSPHRKAPVYKSFFGPNEQARATALQGIIEKKSESTRIFERAHLEVYVMEPARALRFELRRMAHPDTDEKSRRASGNLVVRLLWQDKKNWTKAGREQTYQKWCDDLRMEDDSNVPDLKGLIKEVERLFKERYGEQGTV